MLLKFLNFDPKASREKRKLQLHELEEMRRNAYEPSTLYKEQIEVYHDMKIQHKEIRLGQFVLLFNSRLRLFLGKHKCKWSSPFLVKDVKPCGVVELEDPITKRSWIINGQRLKPYLGGEVERLAMVINLTDP